jgi:hypothetical protein
MQWQEELVGLSTTLNQHMLDAHEDAEAAANTAAELVALVALRPSNSSHWVATVTATSQIVAPANTERRQIILTNDSGSAVFLKFGIGATVDAFTKRLAPNESYETPLNGYAGAISAVRASGMSALQITEVVV